MPVRRVAFADPEKSRDRLCVNRLVRAQGAKRLSHGLLMHVLAWIRDQFSEGRPVGSKARRPCPEVSKSETFKACVAEGHIITPEYRPKVDSI